MFNWGWDDSPSFYFDWGRELSWDEPKDNPAPLSEPGSWGFIGPPGCGKTALIVKLALDIKAAHDSDPRPDKPPLHIISNMKSTHHWAEPLDVVDHLLSMQGLVLAVAILSEAQLYADSRRATSRQNIALSRLFTQLRKLRCLFMFDTQEERQVDPRLRQLVKRWFRPWTPNKARNVGAVITEASQGHLPPWARTRPRMWVKMWDCRKARTMYDTNEIVDYDPLQDARNVATPDGIMSLRPFIRQAVQDMAREGVAQATASRVAEWLKANRHIDVPAQGVSVHLSGLGIPRITAPIDGRNQLVYVLNSETSDE